MASRPMHRVIIGGVLLHLTLGTLYSWGCIQPYVTSYLRLYDPTVTNADTSLVYACTCLVHSLTAPFVGLLQDNRRLGLRGTAALGSALVSGATLASSMATTVLGLAVVSSFFGVGVAFAYTCPLVSGYAWLPDRKGTVTGFVVAGFGAGAAVFDAVATAVVNPTDAPTDYSTGYYGEEIAGRVPLMYLILGSCYLVLGMFGSWMIEDPPGVGGGRGGGYTSLASRELLDSTHGSSSSNSNSKSINDDSASKSGFRVPPAGLDPVVTAASADGGGSGLIQAQRLEDREEEQRQRDLARDLELSSSVGHRLPIAPPPPTAPVDAEGRGGAAVDFEGARGEEAGGGARQLEVWDLLWECDFYHLALTMLCTGVSGLYIAGNYKGLARDLFPNADRFLSILGSVASLFNASGRVIGGLSIDRFGALATLLAQAGSATCVLLILCVVQADRSSFFLGVCLMHSLYGSNFAIYPTLTAEFFGATTAGPNYGLVFMVYGVGSFLGMLWLAAGQKTSARVFLVCAGFSLAGTASAALLRARRRRRRRSGGSGGGGGGGSSSSGNKLAAC